MGAVGIQPRGGSSSPRGIDYVIVLKAGKIMYRHCIPGDVIEVKPSTGKIMPMEDGLTYDQQVGSTETLLDQLIRLKIVKPHTLQRGDKPINVGPKQPEKRLEEPPIENAMNPAPKRAEQAIARPQRGAV